MALHEGDIDRLILDGFGLYTPKSLDQILKVYAPSMEPDQQGLHVTQAWLCRDQYIWFPWFRKQAEKRALMTYQMLNFYIINLLSCSKAFEAIINPIKQPFATPLREYVPKLEHRTLITCAENDLVRPDYEEARMLLDGAESCITPGVRSEEDAATTAAAFAQFLLGN